jgi:hypothetical protein
MANSLYNQYGNRGQNDQAAKLLGEFEKFKSQFAGDPRAKVQQMLDSGQITQAQFEQARQMAAQLGLIK